MRTNQSKRMRGRNRKSQNPMTRVYESNGPDVKIRGSATHIAEKYVQLARDAQASGDPVAAENYYQHAEHYFRMIAAAQEQYRQNTPYYRPEGGESRNDESFDDGDDDGTPAMGGEPGYGTNEPQPYMPRDAQPFPSRDAQPYHQREPHHQREQPYPPREAQPQQQRHQQHPGSQPSNDAPHDMERLPSFITGGAQQQPQQPPQQQPQHQGNGQNGYEGGGQGQPQSDRFPLHRRRRRHRGPRNDNMPNTQGGGEDARQSGD